MKTTIIYWTSTGNTEKIATFIEQGLNVGKESADHIINLKPVSNSDEADILTSDLVILGCSAMGVEEIDTSEMEPFLRAHQDLFKDKSVALFGSYGWGDGEWMENWEVLMESFGAKLETDSLIVIEEPEDEAIDDCLNFGKTLAGVAKA
jgi:flavodoxin short chain